MRDFCCSSRAASNCSKQLLYLAVIRLEQCLCVLAARVAARGVRSTRSSRRYATPRRSFSSIRDGTVLRFGQLLSFAAAIPMPLCGVCDQDGRFHNHFLLTVDFFCDHRVKINLQRAVHCDCIEKRDDSAQRALTLDRQVDACGFAAKSWRIEVEKNIADPSARMADARLWRRR
jgi:hypothetical protein